MSNDKKGNVKVGDVIPAFDAVNEKGEKVTPDTLKGHKNIIFFTGRMIPRHVLKKLAIYGIILRHLTPKATESMV
ncbi:MAG: hypothetical protein IPJ13_29800 [Saprospiraceae bacterium]|nr:hypothetical protein [Saprospiraceae bacterium]